jgi:outer membrane protein assembly factor BamB
MDEGRATMGLGGPSSLSPDSTVEFIIQYANRNDTVTHRLRTITISPTWDLSQEQTHDLNQSVPARTKQNVLRTPLETPPGLGGRHGAHVSFEVEVIIEDGDVYSDHRHTADPLTVPVTDARQFRAVACSAGDGEFPGPVRRVIQQWGFDIYAAEDVQDVKVRLAEFNDLPTLFVGVVPTSGDDEEGRQRVSNAAWAADERATLSIIFADQGVSLPELPPETAVFQCQLADQRELLRVTGPELLVERRALETGKPSQLREVLRQGVSVAKQEPKEILRALAYGTLLTAVGATPQAILDAIEVPDELWTESRPEPTRASNSWPMRGANMANTGYQPQHPAPANDVTTHWTVETGHQVWSSPAVVDGTVYVGSWDNTVYALDAATGRERWTYDTEGSVHSSPAVVDGTVFVGSWDNTVYALDANTGRERWSFATGQKVSSSPVIADDTVYVGSWDHTVYALNAATGRPRWTHGTGDWVRSSPAVADDTVYIGSRDDTLYALDTNTGRPRWTYDTGDWVTSSPAVADGTVYVGSRDDTVYALDAATGRKRWTHDTGDWVRSSPAVANGTVYVGSCDNTVYALDAATGRERWTHDTEGSVHSSPAVVDGTVYVGSGDNTVYALDAATGQERWSFQTGNWVKSSPAVVDGTVYVGSHDNTVYALTES